MVMGKLLRRITVDDVSIIESNLKTTESALTQEQQTTSKALQEPSQNKTKVIFKFQCITTDSKEINFGFKSVFK